MTEETIYQEMLEKFRQSTGYEMNGEADLAVRLRAAAIQIMSLYHYADYVYRQAFPQTASGEGLDRHGELRGVSRNAAAKATGTLTFRMLSAQSVDRTVPKGTVCLTGQLVQFVTTEQGVIPAGETSVTVPAEAVEYGAAGNVLAGTVVRMQTLPAGVQEVVNPEAFSGGRDQEEDEAYRKRILDVYRGVSNGVNEAFYKQLALSVDGVDRVEVVPKINGVGSVGIIVDSDTGTVTDSMLFKVRQAVGQYREVCLELRVYKPESLMTSVQVKIVPNSGCTQEEAAAAVETALRGYIFSLNSGHTLYRSGLIHCAMGTGMIQDIEILTPETDVTAEHLQRIRLQSLTVEGV